MDIIPVLDLMRGVVVRGVAGRRESYQPLASELVEGADPLRIADALGRHFGWGDLYLADLDAIAGAEPAWNVYRGLIEQGWRLRVDAGIHDRARCQALAEFSHGGATLSGVIVGLESLVDPGELAGYVSIIFPERFIFSLDLLEGRPWTRCEAWESAAPLEIARAALDAGVRRFIVLDVATVGVGRGLTTLPLCRQLQAISPQIEIVTGGGVRGLDDLRAVAEAGCDGLLVASALHDGRLSAEEIARFTYRSN